METATRYLTEKLKLKVNQEKSAVDNPWNRKFLGFTFTKGRYPNQIAVHESRTKRMKDKIRGITKRMRGNNLEYSISEFLMPIIRGWANYFGLAEERRVFERLDGWIRRKIRDTLWRQWKKPKTRVKRFVALGIKECDANYAAYSSKGAWRNACTQTMHRAVSNLRIEKMGYIPLCKLTHR